MLVPWLAAHTPSPPPSGFPIIGPARKPLAPTGALEALASNIDTWALIAAVVGIIVGAVMWAFGQFGQNYQQAVNGRKGLLVSGIAAVLIGAAPHVSQWLYSTGSGFVGSGS